MRPVLIFLGLSVVGCAHRGPGLCPTALDAGCSQPATWMGSDTTVEDLRRAFPDLATTPELVIRAPGHEVVRFVVTGTQQGPWDGHPAGGRQVSARGVQVRDGRERRVYLDEQTLRVQLGHLEDDVRPPVAAAEPLVEVEGTADAAWVAASITAWNERRWDGFEAGFSDALVVRDLVHAADLVPPRGLGFLRRIGEVNFPDAHWELRDRFAAGDWWVAEVLFTGTAGEALGPVQGKALAFDLVELGRVEGGRTVELWIVGNGRDFKRQLGVTD